MQQSDFEYALEQFIESIDPSEVIHLVLPGAVISGEIDIPSPEKGKTIRLENARIYAGLQTVEDVSVVIVPYEKILAWGYGEVSSVDNSN